MTWLQKSATALAIAVCTAALIGCSDSTSPGSTSLSDPPGLSSDVQSLETPFQAPAFQSMSALSAGSTPLARTTGLLAALSPIRPASQPQGMSAKPAPRPASFVRHGAHGAGLAHPGHVLGPRLRLGRDELPIR